MLRNKEKGFTLIELLIVIGIIAILAAAVIIAINPGRQFQQARNATRWSHLNSIANATYAYAIDNNGNFHSGCPTNHTDLVLVNETNCGDLTPTYMQALPTDPQGGAYSIRFYDANNNRVVITASSTATDDDLPTVTQ